ncbi:hypothetical protein E8E15_004871 [Penicillium rubens]|uniref:Pc12g00740 protein n=2 Tax=Penicillium chrysogenum species complex TaxID=254878 RepID=B6GXV7_PENRW|nr:uncharacterized protein N7525_002374 [Penicillium rubens]KZN84457.1 hypothetical protein EN45_085950 [Penicillium chrysogenum]CAP79701.1 Pc12g00740 [Penicillium rubens Wisconsin 54-1255]KAF3020777.1 hypothetical protein E8E15_004871 [Penicillium rubens]KAJ5033742.1 hypothetical protein NUH16_005158 [Penicillium rubens]KAJ5844633.1 hypothetical protein N7525_002374 [Penicillium rubens]
MAINPIRLLRANPRLTIRKTSCNTPLARFYASSGTQPPNVSDLASSSPESQAINKSRGMKGRQSHVADTRSAQSPISPANQRDLASETHEGEEPTSPEAEIKNDPSMSTEEKRKNVERAGQRPMGPEDR